MKQRQQKQLLNFLDAFNQYLMKRPVAEPKKTADGSFVIQRPKKYVPPGGALIL